MIKKIFVLFVFFVGSAKIFAQTIFTYGPYAVSKDEFLRAYNKNKTPVTNKEQSLREYLELYTKFKLKVKTAERQRVDTLQQMKTDLQNFRSQIADGYMNDEKRMSELIAEALQRGSRDIHVLHFYVDVNDKMNAADTLKLSRELSELATELQNSKIAYASPAAELEKKYPAVKAKDLGYITVFSMPYDMENLVYNTKPGGVTRLYRTRSALHFFQNVDERPAAGKWKIAQILLSVPPGATAEELKSIGEKADSIYRLLTAGADFASLAKQVSEDKLTYMSGGEMPEFGTGKYEPAFESKAFQLKKDGDISQPVFTGDGYHIIKRLEHHEIATDKSDEAYVATLKQQIAQDSRINAARAEFLKSVKLKTGFKRNAAVKDADLFRYADSSKNVDAVGSYPINNKTIFSFARLSVKGLDWLNFIKDYKLNADVYKGENNKDLLEKFIETSSFDYYRAHLEEYNNDFKYQMEEFKEGNMLFEIMEKNVWSKAVNDSTGLQDYYTAHQSNYKWGASAEILLFNCSNLAVADSAANALRKGKNWRQIADDSEGKLQADSGRYELSQVQLQPGTVLSIGLISTPFSNEDKSASFVKVLTMFPANQQRSFEEAKGLVINDYQGFLEEKWVNELKKNYPVKVDEAVFRSLLK